MDGENCGHCPVLPGLACYRDQGMCDRAARPGEDAFRAVLVRHAMVKAGQMPAVEFTEADLLILACDYRVPGAEECACTDRDYCGLGRGSGANPNQVALADCRRCVAQ